jgi:hypothetical protein
MTENLLLGPADVPYRALGIRVRRVGGNLVLGVQGEALLLEDSAMLIYTSADGRRTVTDIAELLTAEYGIGLQEALSDVSEFLAEMGERGIIAW